MRLIDVASTPLCYTISTLKPLVCSHRGGVVWLGEKSTLNRCYYAKFVLPVLYTKKNLVRIELKCRYIAKDLIFNLAGVEYASVRVKLERKKVDGWSDIVATSKSGEVCQSAYLLSDAFQY